MDPTPYLGLPWEPMGRGPAYDCWGLVRLVLIQEFGWFLPSYQYGRDQDSMLLSLAYGIQHFEQVVRPQSGDLALHTHPLHIGVMVDADRMLHITHGKTSRIERLSSVRRRRVAGFYRLRDSEAAPV